VCDIVVTDDTNQCQLAMKLTTHIYVRLRTFWMPLVLAYLHCCL